MPRTRTRTGPRRWLTITEAVAYSKYGRRTIYKRIADGTLPAYLPRGSRVLRIDGDDLDAMIMAEGRIPSAHVGDGREADRPRTRKGSGDAA